MSDLLFKLFQPPTSLGQRVPSLSQLCDTLSQCPPFAMESPSALGQPPGVPLRQAATRLRLGRTMLIDSNHGLLLND